MCGSGSGLGSRRGRGQHSTSPFEWEIANVSSSTSSLPPRQPLLFSKKNEYFNITKDELFTFIGINVAMGLVRLPRVHDYWSTCPIFGLPWFSAIMPRNRFYEISKYLHLAEASKQKKKGEDGYDPL